MNGSTGTLHAMGRLPDIRLSRDAARRLDREATSRYAIPSIVLMENAAIGLCAHALDMIVPESWALIVCGPGNNGGDGLALARHLTNAGLHTVVAQFGSPGDNAADAKANLHIITLMDIEMIEATIGGLAEASRSRGTPGLIVDALFGTGLKRGIEGPLAEIVEWINQSGAPVLAVDTPSGLDADTGRPLGPTVCADRTVTFVAPKIGFDALDAQAWLGDLHVVGIGAPATLLDELGTGRAAAHPGEHRAPGVDHGPKGRSV